MLHGSPSPGIAASELTHLIAHLLAPSPTATPAAGPPAFAERLGDWLGWTGAIALSAALNGGASAGPVGPASAPGSRAANAPAGSRPKPAAADAAATAGNAGHARDAAIDATAEAAELQHAVDRLAQAISAGPREPGASTDDFGPWRRHCQAMQQAMDQAVAGLRQRLRMALASQSRQGAQLAALDAVLDQHLASQQRQLLGLVPLRLQARFDQLRLAPDGRDGLGVTDRPEAPDWPQTFRHDMDRLLQAELAHRLLPVQGLLDALRTPLS